MKQIASQHPEWKEKEPFRGLLAGEMQPLVESGERAVAEVLTVTHSQHDRGVRPRREGVGDVPIIHGVPLIRIHTVSSTRRR
jgi:hypothetical protein